MADSSHVYCFEVTHAQQIEDIARRLWHTNLAYNLAHKSEHQRNAMPEVIMNADSPSVEEAPVRRGLSAAGALVVALIGGIAAIGATMLVLRNAYDAPVEAALALLALLAFGIAVYGLMQAVLAVIDTAGERRRQERTVSERRQGERARQPKKP